MGFAHRSRSPAQTTNERTYDVLPKPDIFQSYRHENSPFLTMSGLNEGEATSTGENELAIIGPLERAASQIDASLHRGYMMQTEPHHPGPRGRRLIRSPRGQRFL